MLFALALAFLQTVPPTPLFTAATGGYTVSCPAGYAAWRLEDPAATHSMSLYAAPPRYWMGGKVMVKIDPAAVLATQDATAFCKAL